MESVMSTGLAAPSFLDEGTLDLHLADEDENEDDAHIAAEQFNGKVLKDVVAYVEVRSNNDNRSKAFCKELEQLGAEVQSRFTDHVTHVVYKEGTKRTRDRAARRGIHLVSVLWVDSCKQNQEHVSERLFPIDSSNEAVTPLFIAKRKKAKLVQPKDYAEEVASSVERVNKRLKRRALAERYKQLNEPAAHEPTSPIYNLCPFTHILVEDTQQRSPYASPSASIRVNLTIPDTPASMQKKLDRLQKVKKAKARAAGTSPLRGHLEEPLHRQLFASASENMVTDQSVDAVTSPANDTMLTNAKKKRRLLPQKENCDLSTNLVIPTKLSDSSHLPSLLDSVKRNPAVCRSGRKSIAGTGCLSSAINAPGSDKTNVGEKQTLKRKISADAILITNHRVNMCNGDVCSSKDSNTNADKSNTSANRQSGKDQSLVSASGQVRQMANTVNIELPKEVLANSVTCEELCNDNGTDGNVSTKDVPIKTVVGTGTPIQESIHVEQSVSAATKATGPVKKGRRQSMHNSLAQIDDLLSENITTRTTRNDINSLQHCTPSAPALNNNNITCSNQIDSNKSTMTRRTRRASFDVSHLGVDRVSTVDSSQDGCPSSDQSSITDNISSSQTSILGQSMSVLYGDSMLSSSLLSQSMSRPSISEFSLIKYKVKPNAKKQKIHTINEALNELEDSVDDTGELTSANSMMDNSVISSSQEVVQTKLLLKGKLNSHRSGVKKSQQRSKHVSSSSSSSRCSDLNAYKNKAKLDQSCFMQTGQRKRCLVMTNLHTGEQEIVISVVKALGGFYMTDAVCENTTHIVCGEARRTLNVLLGIAQGCWLLSLEWALKSLEHGYWLEEEPYETQQFPAAQLSRADHKQLSPSRKCRLFAEAGAIFVCQKTNPPRDSLVSLVHLCAGKVTTCRRKARVIVGTEFHPDVTSVNPNWILDSVMAYQRLPFDSFMCSRPKRESSPEY